MEVLVYQPTQRHIVKDWALRLTCTVSMAHAIGYSLFTMESGVGSKAIAVGIVVLV